MFTHMLSSIYLGMLSESRLVCSAGQLLDFIRALGLELGLNSSRKERIAKGTSH